MNVKRGKAAGKFNVFDIIRLHSALKYVGYYVNVFAKDGASRYARLDNVSFNPPSIAVTVLYEFSRERINVEDIEYMSLDRKGDGTI